MKVEAKDIPVMQKFMTEFWKTIKDFYGVELTDEYSAKFFARCENLMELYPDPLARELILAFFSFVDKTQRERIYKGEPYEQNA